MADAQHRQTIRVIAVAIVLVAVAIGLFMFLPRYRERKLISKIEQTKSQLRALGNALEVYHVEFKQYPSPEDSLGNAEILDASRPYLGFIPRILTTPIAYLSIPTSLDDPFSATAPARIQYAVLPDNCWILSSLGPDAKEDVRIMEYVNRGKYACCQERGFFSHWGGKNVRYDPTNGLLSEGDLVRTGP